MRKWEYQSVRVRAVYDWNANESKRVAFEVKTAHEEIQMAPEKARVMQELNRLGRQGWEVISVNYDRLPDGVTIEYFMKRPLVE